MTIDPSYIDHCLNPQASHPLYLHLKDLKEALEQFKSDDKLRILDYGCGVSPYKRFWPNASYIRADYLPGPGLDHILEETGIVPENDQSFDLVLSTQVLEHLRKPNAYLAEVLRVLKPGGVFICTTHGVFPDHGCPYDFQRWTVDGLVRDVESAGLEVFDARRMTGNGRALVVFLNSTISLLRAQSFLADVPFKVVRYFFHKLMRPINAYAEKFLPGENVVHTGYDSQYKIYVGILVASRKRQV